VISAKPKSSRIFMQASRKHEKISALGSTRPAGQWVVILIIIGIPSPTHSFTLGLNPFFSANPPYRSLSF